MLRQAMTVFDFLRIKYPDNTHRAAVYLLPALLSLVGTSVLAYLASIHTSDQNINFLLSRKFEDAFTLLLVLPGFYIAALSAIAAINRPAIDEFIHGKTPYLVKQELNRPKGEVYHQPLTRRLFLSLLFAYLASISLFLALSLIAIRSIYSIELLADFAQLKTNFAIGIYSLIMFAVFFIITQIFTLSLVGISYLGYRSMAND